MKLFVISLKRSTERRLRIENQLNNAGVKFTFFDAVDGSIEKFKYHDRASPKKTKLRYGYTLTLNEIACYASHLSMWEKCIQLDEPIIVLEDNCNIDESFYSNFNSFHTNIAKYKFIKLFIYFERKVRRVIETVNDEINIVQYHRRGTGAQGYILTPYVAKKLVENATEFIEPVDNYMEKPWRHGVKTYYYHPNLVTRAKIKSTIGSDRKNKKNLTIVNKLVIEVFRLYERYSSKLYR